jgi:hypothetical protein
VGSDNNGNFVFNLFDQVEISKARVGFEYYGQAASKDAPTTRIVSKGQGYLHDGHYTAVPVVPCNSTGATVAQGMANISVRNGSVSRFAWLAGRSHSFSSFSFGECVTSPAAALGGVHSAEEGGRSYVAEVFPRAQAVISNNVYRSVTMRHVVLGGAGIMARRWADTERWCAAASSSLRLSVACRPRRSLSSTPGGGGSSLCSRLTAQQLIADMTAVVCR